MNPANPNPASVTADSGISRHLSVAAGNVWTRVDTGPFVWTSLHRDRRWILKGRFRPASFFHSKNPLNGMMHRLVTTRSRYSGLSNTVSFFALIVESFVLKVCSHSGITEENIRSGEGSHNATEHVGEGSCPATQSQPWSFRACAVQQNPQRCRRLRPRAY